MVRGLKDIANPAIEGSRAQRRKEAANAFGPVMCSRTFSVETRPVVFIVARQNSQPGNNVLALYQKAIIDDLNGVIWQRHAILLIAARCA